MTQKAGAFLLAALLLLGGVKTGYRVVKNTEQVLDSKTWVTGTAVVDRAYTRPVGCGKYAGHSPCVEYHFNVDSSAFHGNRLKIPLLRSRNERAAVMHLTPYPVGSETQVFYDPDNPSRSVLIRPEINFVYTLGLGGLSLGLCLLSFFVILSQTKSQAS